MNQILEIKNLSKNYGSVKALDNLSFSLEAGKIYGLLGRSLFTSFSAKASGPASQLSATVLTPACQVRCRSCSLR